MEKEDIVKGLLPKDTLNPALFNEKDEVKPEVRKLLAQIATDFVKFTDLDFPIQDLVIVGSNTGYGWDKFSDIDLHFVTDFDKVGLPENLVRQAFDKARLYYNKKYDFELGEQDIEVYVEDVKEKNRSAGRYSLLQNKWLRKPEKKQVEVDEDQVVKKAASLASMINQVADLVDAGNDATEQIDKVKAKIKRVRNVGLNSSEGENSEENLAFKLLRREGLLTKLDNAEIQNKNNNLSLKEAFSPTISKIPLSESTKKGLKALF